MRPVITCALLVYQESAERIKIELTNPRITMYGLPHTTLLLPGSAFGSTGFVDVVLARGNHQATSKSDANFYAEKMVVVLTSCPEAGRPPWCSLRMTCSGSFVADAVARLGSLTGQSAGQRQEDRDADYGEGAAGESTRWL